MDKKELKFWIIICVVLILTGVFSFVTFNSIMFLTGYFGLIILGILSIFTMIIYTFVFFFKKLSLKKYIVTLICALMIFLISLPNILFLFEDYDLRSIKDKSLVTKKIRRIETLSKFSIAKSSKIMFYSVINSYLSLTTNNYIFNLKEYGGYQKLIDNSEKYKKYLCKNFLGNYGYCYDLAIFYLYLEEYDKIINLEEKLYKKHKISPTKTLLDAYIYKGEYQKALALSEDFIKNTQNKQDLAIKKCIQAQIYKELKDYDKALELSKDDKSMNCKMVRAGIYQAMGNKKEIDNLYNEMRTYKKYSNYSYNQYMEDISSGYFYTTKWTQKKIKQRKAGLNSDN